MTNTISNGTQQNMFNMVVMIMMHYSKVISRLPLLVRQNINVEAPPKFEKETINKD